MSTIESNTSGGASPVPSPAALDPASPPSVAQEPAAQEAGSPAPAQPAEPGALMSLDRIGGLITRSE